MATRKIIRVDEELCTGCGLCLPACAEGALEMVDGKPRLVAEKYCDGLGACLGVCPVGALIIEEREADEFDEDAVHERLKGLEAGGHEMKPAPPAAPTACASARMAQALDLDQSNLGHWPVQLRLVPETASWLKGADLMLTADCAPVALPDFHSRHLPGKTILLACPKFDEPESSVQRLAAILGKNDIGSLSILRMEVPCCGGLGRMVQAALRLAGKDLPVREVVVGVKGGLVDAPKERSAPAPAAVLPGF